MNSQEIKQKTAAMRGGNLKMARDREYWTQEDKEILEREYRAGTSGNEIALMLERSESAIHQKVEQMGLCVRYPFTSRKRTDKKKGCKCLCENCKCDPSECPLCKVYETVLEGM